MNQEVKTINGYKIKDEKAVRTYDSVALMKADRNLKKGQHVKTRGYFNINDGEGANYYITDTQSQSNYQENLENGLYATLLNNFENNFYDEINFIQERYYDTDCYFTTIPLNDKDNKQIDLYMAHREYKEQTPLKYAQDKLTSFTMNGALWIDNTDDVSRSGIPCVIGNGQILLNNDFSNDIGVADNYLYIGIKENRDIVEFKVNETTPQQLLDAGCKNVFNCFFKLINNYQATDLTDSASVVPNIVNDYHPRQVFCEMADKSIMILSTDGRDDRSRGLTCEQLQNILIEKEVKNAWNLDGGGSTSTEIKTIKINKNIDDSYTSDREIPYTLNVKKPTKNKNSGNVYSYMSKMFHFFNERYQNEKIRVHNIAGKDANDLYGKLIIGSGTSVVNTPISYCYLINIPDVIDNDTRYNYNYQICIGMSNFKIWKRYMRQGAWSEWTLCDSPLSGINCNDYTLLSGDYETIPISSVSNYDSTSIVKNNDNTFSFNDIGNKLLYLECRISGTIGYKFIRLMKGTTIVRMQSCYVADTTHYQQLILIAPIQISSTDDKFHIEINGDENDTIANMGIYIK